MPAHMVLCLHDPQSLLKQSLWDCSPTWKSLCKPRVCSCANVCDKAHTLKYTGEKLEELVSNLCVGPKAA